MAQFSEGLATKGAIMVEIDTRGFIVLRCPDCKVQRGALDMDYGLIRVLSGAAFACAVVIHLWLTSRREARQIERRVRREARQIERRVAGLRDEYREGAKG